MLIPAITAELNSWKDDRDPSIISISSLGHCARALAYRYHKVKGREIDARGKAILDDGDRGHAQLRAWIRKGLILTKSCYALMAQELEVTLLPGLQGHIDGLLRHRITCKVEGHENELLEVKTINDRGFKRAKEGDIDSHYLDQVYGYLDSLNLKTARFLFKNKNTAELFETTRTLDKKRLDSRLDVIDLVKKSASPEAVPREHAPKKGGYLDWQCNYCPFVSLCWRHEGVTEVTKMVYKVVKVDEKSPPVL